MSDTPRTDKAAFSLDFPCESEKVVQADFARQFERENAELFKERDKWKWASKFQMWCVIVFCLWAVVLHCTGCTLGNETPAERKARKVLEPAESYQFHNGRWEQVK